MNREAYELMLPLAACTTCGGQIRLTAANKEYCSDACRQKAYRNRHAKPKKSSKPDGRFAFKQGAGMTQPLESNEAEKAVLGAILANNNALKEVHGFLSPEHFSNSTNGLIYETCVHLIRNRKMVADPISLRKFFEGGDYLDKIGGARYLGELAASMISIINVRDYGRQIRDLSVKRQARATSNVVAIHANAP